MSRQPDIWRGPIRNMQNLVCSEFGLKLLNLTSHRRSKGVMAARHIAFWLCRHYTQASYPVIGQHFEGRDHTTIINGCQKAEDMMKRDPVLKRRVDKIIAIWAKHGDQE